MIEARTSTWPDIQAAWQSGKIAILPFGAQEEHGPHCPLSTDTRMADGFAARLAAELDAVLLPAIPYGETWSTSGFPGTISLSPETIRSIVLDIGRSLHDQGVRALVIINGHFGNRAPIELACRELKSGLAFPVLLVDYPGMEQLAQEICDSAPAAPSFYHADEVETSIMLALAPGDVRMERAAAEYPVFPPTFGAEPILLNTFCCSGVFGDPRPATAEKGEKLLQGLTEKSLVLIRRFLEEI
jgi:creatinine amidohydrolase